MHQGLLSLNVEGAYIPALKDLHFIYFDGRVFPSQGKLWIGVCSFCHGSSVALVEATRCGCVRVDAVCDVLERHGK